MDNRNYADFNYENCLRTLDKIVDPTKADLPPEILKENSLRRINESVRGYKLPVLYRYTSVSLNSILSILNETVYMPSASSLNDVFEGAPYGTLSSYESNILRIREIQDDIYVKSFSCKKNNNLMWSHYGDSHKGICIGYDFSLASDDVISHLYPVQYSNTRFSSQISDNIATHSFLYLRKSKCWAYEKEFRLLYKKGELPQENQDIPLNCITEIQFGLRMPDDQKKLIAELVREKNKMSNKRIELFETKLKNNGFKLERIEYGNPDFR